MKLIKSSEVNSLMEQAVQKAVEAYKGEGDKGAALGELLDLAVVKSELLKIEKSGEEAPGLVMVPEGLGAQCFVSEQTTEIGKSVSAFKSEFNGSNPEAFETTASALLEFVKSAIDEGEEGGEEGGECAQETTPEDPPAESTPAEGGEAAPTEKSAFKWSRDLSAEFAQDQEALRQSEVAKSEQKRNALAKSAKPDPFSWDKVEDGRFQG